MRNVTFHENDSRRHSGAMRSSRMRLPAFGARGSMRVAGRSRSVANTAAQVATSVTPTPRPAANPASPRSMGSGPCGTK